MDQITVARTNRSAVRRNKIKTFFSKPHNVILLLMGIVLTFSTVAPIIAIVEDTFKIHPGTIDAYLTGKASGYTVVNYIDLFTSDKAMINLWTPLLNTIWQWGPAWYPLYSVACSPFWSPAPIWPGANTSVPFSSSPTSCPSGLWR